MKNQIAKSFRNLFSHRVIVLLLFLITLFTIFNGGVHVYIKDLFTVLAFVVLWPSLHRTKNTGLLLAFCVTNALLSFINHISGSYAELFCFLLSPVVFYLYGYSVDRKRETENDTAIFLLLTIVSSSFLLWSTMIDDASVEGIINISRHVYEEGEIRHAATLLGLIASIGIGGVAYTIMYGIRSKFTSLLFLVCSLLSLFAVFHLVNRSGIVVFILSILSATLYSVKGNKGSILVVLLIIAALYFFFGQADLFTTELLDAYDSRSESLNTGGERFTRWRLSLGYLFQYPFGWRQLSIMGYSHNLWLDVAASVGWIPFVLLLVFTVRCYKTTYLLYTIKGHPFNGFLIGLNVCFLMSAFVEPIIESVSTYFCIMCLIWGIQQSHLESLTNHH